MPSLSSIYMDAHDLAEALANKKMSAVELTKEIIAHIEKTDVHLNAICVRDFARALDAALAADEALARRVQIPLLGVPLTVKETFNVAGLPTTWGIPAYKDFVAQKDALVVSRAKAAGAIILGKTNISIGASDWQSYNENYGVTNNPFNTSRTCGGSSGGSAAALAAGFGALSLGSDVAGSLRVPANFCGIYAHKPSLNLVPLRGHIPPHLPAIPITDDLVVMGPMARSARDLALLLDVIAGPDEIDDGLAYKLQLPASRHSRLEDFKILALSAHPLTPTDSRITAAIDELAGNLSKCGADVVRESSSLPDLKAAARLYARLLNSQGGARLPAETYSFVQEVVANLKAEGDSFFADYLRGVTLSHRDWIIDNFKRAGQRSHWRQFFSEFDAIICPSAPTLAFPHDHRPNMEERIISIENETLPYRNLQIWPGIATGPGLPATAIPIGMSNDGLPIGVQIIGAYLDDRTTIKLAELIEREFGGFRPPQSLRS